MTVKIIRWNHKYAGLWIGGAVTLAIGVMHFFMPTWGYDSGIPMSMSAPIREHFYYLGTYAISGFLLALGSFSLYLANRKVTDVARVFSGVMLAFWILRTSLELLYPTELTLFVLERPVFVLLPTMIITALSYGLGLIALSQSE